MHALEVKNISKAYGAHQALTSVSINVPHNSIYGLLGPNGAGKTTLIRIITQIIFPDEGEILLQGKKVSAELVRKIGYLPEERGLYKKMKVGEHLVYLGRLKGLSKAESHEKVKFWLDKLGLKEWTGKLVEDLSKGMQQKVQFIATVLHDPTLIILDEPFSGFDPVNADLIKDEIFELKEKGVSIIFSTHRMESVEELCDHIALINKSKKILEGPKKEIKERYRTATFQIRHYEDFPKENGLGQLISSEKDSDGLYHTIVKLASEDQVPEFLQKLTNYTSIRSFEEKIPSIHDIFVKEVKG